MYKQIADDLRARIHGGELEPGDDVPTEAELADQWATSRGPIRNALALLRGEGLIETNVRKIKILNEEELKKITEELPRYEAMLKGINAAIAAAGSNYEQVETLLIDQKETQEKVDALTERWCELEDLKGE